MLLQIYGMPDKVVVIECPFLWEVRLYLTYRLLSQSYMFFSEDLYIELGQSSRADQLDRHGNVENKKINK